MHGIKFYHRDEDQMMVEWVCPSCGGPVNQPVADASYKKFLKIAKSFHPLETLCPTCIQEIGEVVHNKVLRAPDILPRR